MSILEIHREIAKLSAEKDRLKKEFEADQNSRAVQIRLLEEKLSRASAGFDEGLVRRGREIISIRGTYARGGDEKTSVIRDAIAFFANESTPRQRNLNSTYYGTKSYAHWHGQRCDCEYGYGPKHGHIIFAVELRPDYRNAGLSEEDKEACVYLLSCLEALQAAEAEQAA